MTPPVPAERYDLVFGGKRPVLETARLIIRPFVDADAHDIERLAGDFLVAKTLLNMPHPYPKGAAFSWIAKHEELWNSRKELPLAITRREHPDAVAGAISARFVLDHHYAELGYWIAHANWGQGMASEATHAVLHWSFMTLGLHRVMARHMATNPVSGAVMRRNGMRLEGTLREHHWKNGVVHNFHVYGILRDEFLARTERP